MYTYKYDNPDDLTIGGSYIFEREIGQEYLLSTLYLAKDIRLGRNVTIGILKPEYQNIWQEIRSYARLQHQNIPQIYNMYEGEEVCYIIMRDMPTESVKDQLSICPFSLHKASKILNQITSALEYAYTHDLFIYNIKSSNILLDKHDTPILSIIDSAINWDRFDTMDPNLSPYMAPERWNKKTIDSRTQVYSLGIILFEMLTGILPFSSGSEEDYRRHHLFTSVPSILHITPCISRRLDLFIQKATAKDPEQRPQSPYEFAQEFAQIADYEAKLQQIEKAKKEALQRVERAMKEASPALDLSGLGLTAIPPSIGYLTTLKVLNLNENQLTSIPPEVIQLIGLTVLDLGNNQLTTIPANIAQLVELREFHLRENRITTLPSEIRQLTKLMVIELRGNLLTDVPLGIMSQYDNPKAILGYIEALSRIKQVNDSLATELDLSNLGLTAVPPEIGQLTGLTYLDLSENKLTAVPPEIGQLTGLMQFRLDGNKLTTVPPEIRELTALTELALNDNQLTAIPTEIGQLTALTALLLSINQLTAVLPEIGQLTALTELSLYRNQLTAIPPEIMQLTGLMELNLSGNQLTAVPPEITQLTKLRYLNLKDNPDLPIPPEITSQRDNPQVILDYIRELNVAPAENTPLNEAKVILVGRGEAGKTSLVKRLVHNSFDPHEKQTDGVNVVPWELAVDRPAQGIVPIALNIWDFGGQEILHATHKFFLTERSLYLIVIEPRQDDYRQQVEYWLSLIHDVAADSPVIIVINKIDLQRLDVDRRGLQKKYPNIIQTFTPISAATGEGMDDLKTAITTALASMDEVDTPFPPSWMAVKQALAAMKTDHPHMPYHAYEQLCRDEGVADKSSQRSLIGFLHRLGVVLNFQDDGRVRHTNVLDPNWISDGVYKILTNPLPQTQKGELHRNQLPFILPAAYEEQHEFMLEMMLKFELAYELRDRSVLIPDLIAEEEPAYEWNDETALQFEYQYDVLRRSTLHRLMVRRHNWINPVAVWRTGVMLQKDGISALIRADIEAKTIRISINGKGNDGSYGPRQFLYALRLEFADIHDSIKGTKPEEVVPIPNYPDAPPIAYAYLEKLETMNAPDQQLFPKTDEFLSIQGLLNGVSTPAIRQAGLPTRQQLLYAIQQGEKLGSAINIENVTINNIQRDYVQGNKADGDILDGDKISIDQVHASTVEVGRQE